MSRCHRAALIFSFLSTKGVSNGTASESRPEDKNGAPGVSTADAAGRSEVTVSTPHPPTHPPYLPPSVLPSFPLSPPLPLYFASIFGAILIRCSPSFLLVPHARL